MDDVWVRWEIEREGSEQYSLTLVYNSETTS
jgi:hypothetical protein